MKVLIIGPSGSGKTYVSTRLRQLGANTIDADSVAGLSSWYDGIGNKVEYPKDADQEFLANHSFLWDREFLKEYLHNNPNIYLFGSSENMFNIFDLFDKVYFLRGEPDLIKERLTYKSRENPMGKTEFERENAVNWGKEKSKKREV